MTPALWARLFVATTAEVASGLRFSVCSIEVLGDVDSAGFVVDAVVANSGVELEGASSCTSWSVSCSDSECSMVSFCLLERWLASPAVLLSAATSEELLKSPSSSL